MTANCSNPSHISIALIFWNCFLAHLFCFNTCLLAMFKAGVICLNHIPHLTLMQQREDTMQEKENLLWCSVKRFRCVILNVSRLHYCEQYDADTVTKCLIYFKVIPFSTFWLQSCLCLFLLARTRNYVTFASRSVTTIKPTMLSNTNVKCYWATTVTLIYVINIKSLVVSSSLALHFPTARHFIC